MTNTAAALYSFFSGFGIPAYEENSVPNDAELPYITYQIEDPDWSETGSISASVWYKGDGFRELFTKVDEIKRKTEGGIRVPTGDGGCLYIFKDSPFAQVQPAERDDVKVAYLLFVFHALCD